MENIIEEANMQDIPTNMYSFEHPYTARNEVIERLKQDPMFPQFEKHVQKFSCDDVWGQDIYEIESEKRASIWEFIKKGAKPTQIIITDSNKPDATKFAVWCMYLLAACDLLYKYQSCILCVESKYISPGIAQAFWDRGFDILYDEANSMGLGSILPSGTVTRSNSLRDGIALAIPNNEYEKICYADDVHDIRSTFYDCDLFGMYITDGLYSDSYITRVVSLGRCDYTFPALDYNEYTNEWRDNMMQEIIHTRGSSKLSVSDFNDYQRKADKIAAYMKIWNYVLDKTCFELKLGKITEKETLRRAKEFADTFGITQMIEAYDAGVPLEDLCV
jgi:hypothetical protein